MGNTLDKMSVTKGQKQYHIALSPEDIGEYVLLPGDPARSDIAAGFLEDARLMANNREHRTFTGYYHGIRISVTSSDDTFYGETPEFLDKLRSYRVLNLDMESSALYTIAHLRGVRAATINGTSGNLTNAEVIYTRKNEKLHEAWEQEIRIVLEAILRMERQKAASR